VHYEHFIENPDFNDSLYKTPYGIYDSNCGLDSVHLSYGHDEYLYQVCKNYLPQEALYIIRYHSFYAAHRENEYKHLMNEFDNEMMKYFNFFF
jgi:inositol oxygenase